MLKYVIYTVIIVALLGIGFYFAVKFPVQLVRGEIAYSITGCLGRSENQTRAADSVDFSTDGSSIIITHSLSHNCCQNLTMDQSIDSGVITITEKLRGSVCRCYCHSDITATVKSLEKKKYAVNLYKDEGTPVLIESREITIS